MFGKISKNVALHAMILLTFALVSSFIGMADPIVSRRFGKAFKVGLSALGYGLLWGFFGGMLAGVLYLAIQTGLVLSFRDFLTKYFPEKGYNLFTTVFFMVCRTPAWTLLGAGAGLVPGFASGTKKIMANGFIGGILGGTIGGMVFDPIAFTVYSLTGNTSAGISRVLAFCSLGAMIGGGGLSILVSSIAITMTRKLRRSRPLASFSCMFLGVLMLVFGVFYTLYSDMQTSSPRETMTFDRQKNMDMIEKAADLIKEPLKANLLIQSGYGLGQAFGSGVAIKNKDGKTYILTNLHVLTGSASPVTLDQLKKKVKNLKVTYYDSTVEKAEVLWVAPSGMDVALIVANTPLDFTSSATIGTVDNVKLGEKVFAIGNPMGLDWTYTEGVVSGFRKKKLLLGDDVSVIQIQTPLNHGNSGGGLYSEKGLLIGINTWIYEKAVTEGLNFSIAIDEFVKALSDEMKNILFSEK